jgi:hypothetical protein
MTMIFSNWNNELKFLTLNLKDISVKREKLAFVTQKKCYVIEVSV